MYKVFSARGWRTREPASEDIAPDGAVLAQSIGQSLSAREVASIAGFSEPSRNSLFPPSGLRAVGIIRGDDDPEELHAEAGSGSTA